MCIVEAWVDDSVLDNCILISPITDLYMRLNMCCSEVLLCIREDNDLS